MVLIQGSTAGVATLKYSAGRSGFDERKKLVDKLKAEFSADWPTFDSAAQARVVAGLTSVADWIGSGEFFEKS
ncbi:CRISPR-associated Cas3 family helicase [Klebsiella pneumoniae]|uniref:CRISPR-associated Cas3 family helicase n=1 Tax=Klebsiella pneumoniae TaxID=573 RepID=A0A377V1P2_KLEPN|nr:CRISPR-associated Cas3 family helicase [Klebsiella pneumoniae]